MPEMVISLFKDTLSTFFVNNSIVIRNIFRNKLRKEGRKEMFYLMTHSTHFIYSYVVSNKLKKKGKKWFI